VQASEPARPGTADGPLALALAIFCIIVARSVANRREDISEEDPRLSAAHQRLGIAQRHAHGHRDAPSSGMKARTSKPSPERGPARSSAEHGGSVAHANQAVPAAGAAVAVTGGRALIDDLHVRLHARPCGPATMPATPVGRQLSWALDQLSRVQRGSARPT